MARVVSYNCFIVCYICMSRMDLSVGEPIVEWSLWLIQPTEDNSDPLRKWTKEESTSAETKTVPYQH